MKPSANITLTQLVNLQVSIAAFITQLQSSGTTSPVTLKRVDTLKYILNKVSDIITKVQNGNMKESEIPITVADYKAFLPFVDPSNTDVGQGNPLPHLLSETGANAGLANLFPAYFAGDISGAQLAQQLFQQYAPSIFTDMSYDITVKLGKKSESERILAASATQAVSNGLFGGSKPLHFADSGSTYGAANSVTGNSNSGGMFNSVINGLMGNKPATLDWKDRSNQICQQISKRDMNPYEFGCLKDPNDVEQNFSYRGYAKMVCARLETIYDTSVPELCGCPPPTWSGWRP